MRIALHNEYYGQQTAEAELSRRIAIAARRLGWEAIEVGTSEEILSLRPDFVLALHFRTPKLTEFPTYGCLWNPPSVMEREPQFLRNVLSYDAYLTSCEQTSRWVRQLIQGCAKRTFVAPIYTSCPRRPWRAPCLEAPRLAYLGTNWDGSRFRELFEELAGQLFFDIYGPAGRWEHASVAYRGPLPFDGETVQDVLNRSGAALCLHRPEHREAGIPSSRIFEIASSGAIAICQEHSFIRQKFGDTVLYLDEGLAAPELARQIGQRFQWICDHPEVAREMSRKAHAIFDRELSLEGALEGIGRAHRQLADKKHGAAALARSSAGKVDVVVRTGKRPAAMLARALTSIAGQTYPDIRVLIVKHGPEDISSALACCPELDVTVIEVPHESPRSTSLWTGLKAASGDFVANLDDDDRWFPGHLATLIPLIAAKAGPALAYSGAVRRLERRSPTAPPTPTEPASLSYHDPFDRARLFSMQNYIMLSALALRRELVAAAGDDPLLDLWEDLLLMIRFARMTEFVFSGEVTAEYFHRTSLDDNAVFLDGWESAGARVRQLAASQPCPTAAALKRS